MDVTNLFQSTDPTFRCLGLLATCGVATHQQLLYFVGEASGREEEAASVLQTLQESGFIGMVVKSLPVQMQSGQANVYYLESRGRQQLPDGWRRKQENKFIKVGKPEGENYKRIPHELLITEAVLYLHGQHQVLGFTGENALRSQHLRSFGLGFKGKGHAQQVEREERMTEEMGRLTMGDFQVILRNAVTGEMQFVYGEAALRYAPHELKGKPGDLMWFVADIEQAKRVQLYSDDVIPNENILVLGNVLARGKRALRPAQQPRGKKHYASPAKQKLYAEMLRQFPCGLSASGLAVLFSQTRGHAAKVLKRLLYERTVHSFRAAELFGYKEGRPTMIYLLASMPSPVAEDLEYAVLVNRILVQNGSEQIAVTYRPDLHSLVYLSNPTNEMKSFLTRYGWRDGREDAFQEAYPSAQFVVFHVDSRLQSFQDLRDERFQIGKEYPSSPVVFLTINDNVAPHLATPRSTRWKLLQESFSDWKMKAWQLQGIQ